MRTSHRSEQDGVAAAGALERLARQGYAVGVDGAAADGRVVDFEPHVGVCLEGLEDLQRFGDDFRPDAVARKQQYLSAHVTFPTGDCGQVRSMRNEEPAGNHAEHMAYISYLPAQSRL